MSYTLNIAGSETLSPARPYTPCAKADAMHGDLTRRPLRRRGRVNTTVDLLEAYEAGEGRASSHFVGGLVVAHAMKPDQTPASVRLCARSARPRRGLPVIAPPSSTPRWLCPNCPARSWLASVSLPARRAWYRWIAKLRALRTSNFGPPCLGMLQRHHGVGFEDFPALLAACCVDRSWSASIVPITRTRAPVGVAS
jgi:hypothetical protein